MDSTIVKEIQYPKVNTIEYEGKEKILLLINEYEVFSTLDIVEDIYTKLSKLKLTPLAHNYGRFVVDNNEFLYLITDYVPLTLAKIGNKQLKNDLLRRALIIAYAIHGMGIYKQDLHDENFLYDDINDKLYAIDFSLIKNSDKPKHKLTSEFYLSDKEYVTPECILEDVY